MRAISAKVAARRTGVHHFAEVPGGLAKERMAAKRHKKREEWGSVVAFGDAGAAIKRNVIFAPAKERGFLSPGEAHPPGLASQVVSCNLSWKFSDTKISAQFSPMFEEKTRAGEWTRKILRRASLFPETPSA